MTKALKIDYPKQKTSEFFLNVLYGVTLKKNGGALAIIKLSLTIWQSHPFRS